MSQAFNTTESYNNNENCFNDNDRSFNTNSFNTTTYNYTTSDAEILAWLSPLEPRVRHQDIRARRVDCVGAWLLETEEFKRWQNGSREDESYHSTLFCNGNPGVGKSYIVYESMICCRVSKTTIANRLRRQSTSNRQALRRGRR